MPPQLTHYHRVSISLDKPKEQRLEIYLTRFPEFIFRFANQSNCDDSFGWKRRAAESDTD